MEGCRWESVRFALPMRLPQSATKPIDGLSLLLVDTANQPLRAYRNPLISLFYSNLSVSEVLNVREW